MARFIDIWRAVRCEFSTIFHDGGALLLLVIALPLYTIIYSFAYGSEVVRDVDIAVVDNDNSSSSRIFVEGLTDGPNTKLRYRAPSLDEAKALFFAGEVYGIIDIPHGFEANLLTGNQANIGLILDGSHLLLYRQVLEQVASDALQRGAMIELLRLTNHGIDKNVALSIIEPVNIKIHHIYNRALGYGTFVMPSVVMVIIQQTLVIGLAMIATRRRHSEKLTLANIIAKILVYMIIYGVNLTIILCVIWNIFGFANVGNTTDIVLFMALYLLSTLSLALIISMLFHKRESPLMLLLWCSVPILLLAGVSYPREAFPEWLYWIGRVLPSSSGVDGFIAIASRGASLDDIKTEVTTLLVLSVIYMTLAIIINKKRARE